MAKQILNNGDSGEDFRTKLNENYTELYDREELTSTLKDKIDGIEDGATADQTGAEIKTAYEGEDDTNAFTDAEKSKVSDLSGVNSGDVTIADSDNIALTLDGQKITADLKATDVTAGDYTSADITIDANGRITSASNGSGGGASDYTDLGDTPDNYTDNAGKYVLVNDAEDGLIFGTPGGDGDMKASDYDPDSIVGDAFDMGNMKESSTKKIFSDTERAKLDGIGDNAEENIQSDFTETDNTLDSFIKNKPDLSVYQTTANLIDEDDMASDDDTKYPTQQSVKAYADTKEPAITKNTAFNKDFGTTADTVLEGNTNVGIVGTKEVDETDLADTKMLAYDDGAGKLVYIDQPSGGGGGGIETVQITGEQVAGTKIFEYNADSDKTIGNVKISLEVANEGADFIVKAYKNGTDLDKDITIADGGGDAVNDRYVASLDIVETLVDGDVFELKIDQVGSNVSGSEFLALINIT